MTTYTNTGLMLRADSHVSIKEDGLQWCLANLACGVRLRPGHPEECFEHGDPAEGARLQRRFIDARDQR